MSQPENTPDPRSENNPGTTHAAAGKSRRGSGLLVTFLIVLLIVSGVTAFAGWKFWQEIESAILASNADTGSLKASQRQLENDVNRLQNALVTRQQLDDAITTSAQNLLQVNDRISQTERAVETLRQATAGGNTSMVRAEARYLVQIANDELLLRGNTANALRALHTADTRLRDAGSALFGNVRASIAQNILALESLPDPDITGMALTLASLANAVDSLPLRTPGDVSNDDEEVLPEDASAWERFKAATKRLFGTVVTVRHDANPRPFVTPGQEYFLLRNLELKLESTRLSLLMGDADNFQAGADVSLRWLELYFDTNDSGVDAAREQLLLMRAATLPTDFPDLSETLYMLEAGE